jgi:preprotein translocase subunit Sec61beta
MKEINSSSLFKSRHRLGKNAKSGFLSFFSEYETPKVVLIHSFTFAVLLRIMQIIILIYSVLYLLIYEQGYQKHDTAIISSVTLKVKGIGYINTTQNQTIVIDVAGMF